MKRNFKRLGLALVISVLCFLGTVLWYDSGLKKRHPNASSGQPVARLSDSTEDVQRREPKRVMWEPIKGNEELFAGDAIRTNTTSNAKFILLKSGATLQMEPDSLVVLEETGNGLTLNFLQGQLHLQSHGADQDVLLKTDSGLLKLKDAELSLSKNSSGPTNLEVHKGHADFETNGKTVSIPTNKSAQLSTTGVSESRNLLQVLYPRIGQTHYLGGAKSDKLKIQWPPLSKNAEVTVEIGARRSSLKPVGQFNGASGLAQIPLKPGKWFMRLSSKSSDQAETVLASSVLPLNVEQASPPTLVQPSPGAPILRDQADAQIEFKWVGRNIYQQQIFQLAKDSEFKQIVSQKEFDGRATSYKTTIPDGHYHWRVVSKIDNQTEADTLTSARQEIEVASKWELQAAQATHPQNGHEFTLQDVQKSGVELKWNPSPGSQHFRVVVEKKTTDNRWQTAFENETEAHILALANLPPSNYRWKVTSYAAKGNPSGVISDYANFTVGDLGKLEWSRDQTSDYEYPTPNPSLRTDWSQFTGAKSYRYRISPEGQDLNKATWLETKQLYVEAPIREDGRYSVAVEALGPSGQPIAKADPRIVQVRRRPQLPAPTWTTHMPEVVRPDEKGKLALTWLPVSGAHKYLVILENGDGWVVQKRSTEHNSTTLPKLKSGHYQVKLKSVDAFERMSADGQPKHIEIPATPDMQAPRIKRVKVK